MPKTSFNPVLFLERYRELVRTLAQLAASARIAPARLRDELSRDPFVVPASMRGLDGASEIAAGLETLAQDLPRDQPESELDAQLLSIIKDVIASVFRIPRAAKGGKKSLSRPRGVSAEPPVEAESPFEAIEERPAARDMTLGVPREQPSPAPAPEPSGAAPPGPATQPDRWINAEIEDHSLDDPLELGTQYTIAFDIDVVRRPGAATGVFNDRGLFPDSVYEVTLTVQLGGDDFEIADNVRQLRVPRTGKSRGKARFDITPKKRGRAVLHAIFSKENNFIQEMEVALFVVAAGARAASTAPAEVTSHGRPLTTAGTLQARDVGFRIKPAAGGGYECAVWGSVRTEVKLPVTDAQLATQIELARQELLTKVIMQQDATGNQVFLTGIDIPEAESEKALRTLARAGSQLFRTIFHHVAAGPEAQKVGNWLRDVTQDKNNRLKIQILADGFPVPWGLLYVGSVASNAKLDWDNFLGFRHVIEQIPFQAQFGDPGPTIASRPRLSVSVNVNEGIDKQMGMPFVANQRTFWTEIEGARPRVRVTRRRTRTEVLEAFGEQPQDDQIAYFYCHADSANLTARGGPDSSCLVMSGDEKITLDDLKTEAPTDIQLGGKPLVFINACESAELSPAFYDGFVPYFMAKGSRGVIGTECKTPALFAAEWAKRFFPRLLDGESIGDVFLALRQEFLQQHRNPLGLLYAVYCDGDTQVAPAL